MKKYLLPILALSTLLSVSVKADTTPIKTYIVAGQSNANGFGLGDGDLYSGTLVPNQNLSGINRGDLLGDQNGAYIFKGGDNSGLGEWQTMKAGFGSWNGKRFGPALSFTKRFRSHTGAKVAIIKYTPDGTSLYTDWNPEDANSRYRYFLDTIANAKTAALDKGWSLDISGVLWMQGESDSFGTDAPAAYEQNLANFIAKVRADLSLPTLAFHIGQIADTATWPAREQIWNAQESVAMQDDNAYLVNGKDLPLFTDDSLGLSNTHYTTEGTVTLGERFANSIARSETIPSYPTSAKDYAITEKNKAVSIDVLANDTGRDLRITDVNFFSANGGITRIVDGKLLFTPKPSFTGDDTLWYEFSDYIGRTNSAEVTIKVVKNAPFPVAITEALDVRVNTAIVFDALANDVGVGLAINEVNRYSVNGGMIAEVAGKLRYTPKPNYIGNDSFWYAIRDYRGRTNAIKVTVSIGHH